MEKKKKKHVALVVAIVVTALAVVYIGIAFFFQSHFCFGTVLDGIPVGGYNAAKAEQAIKEEIDGYSLTLLGREDGEEVITGSSIKVAPIFHGEVEALIKKQNGFAWIATLFQKEELELERVVTYEEAALDDALFELSCMQPQNQRKPVDAEYSDYVSGKGYELVAADYGTTLDKTALKKAVGEAILVLDDTLDLDKAGCYVEPEVGDDDNRLLSLIDELNSYAGVTITYDFGEKSETLDGDTISQWLTDEDWKVSVDQEAATAYIKGLGKKYNTAYATKTLQTSYGREVTISGGAYGWKIDNSGELEQLLADLKAGKDVEREPIYAQTANSHGENDYGDYYVEINLTAQHLFVYKNGALVVESDFVSGNVSKGHASPTGAYGLTYKTKDAVLRGEDYETPVKYWMPFAGDVGMHDATWRRSFGGSIYMNNGSHGCINLPLSVAKKIYETVDKGYAVLVYKLPGTESVEVQQQEADSVINTINSIETVTLESEPIIVSARSMYDALPGSVQALVTNYDVLVAAEASLAQLKATQVPVQP